MWSDMMMQNITTMDKKKPIFGFRFTAELNTLMVGSGEGDDGRRVGKTMKRWKAWLSWFVLQSVFFGNLLHSPRVYEQ